MNHHIKEHPITLLAVLVGAILILTVAIYALSPAGPTEEVVPEGSEVSKDVDLLRRPEVSLPEFNIETTWSRPSEATEPEEPTIGALETSSQGAETLPEESNVDVSSADGSADESAPVTEPSAGPISDNSKPLYENDFPKEYTLHLCVTSTSGKLLKGAEVVFGNVSGKTGSDGCFSATVTDPDTSLLIVASGYVSYYEDLLLTDSFLDTTVLLAPVDTTRRLLNSVVLNPYRTDNAEFNQALDRLMGEILKPGMDTYDKVKTCYDWVIAHMYYQRPSHKEQGHWACAYQALQDGYGTCNCYSLLFTAMVRYIGLNCYYVEGSTSASGGGYTGHYWTVIEIGGEFYIFDPQVEDAIADRTASKEVTYIRFCLKEPHAKYIYNVRSFSSCIKNFESYLQAHGKFLAQ